MKMETIKERLKTELKQNMSAARRKLLDQK